MQTRAALLAWYEPRRDRYPWRRAPDPYRVLVSEVMLQQTQAPRVEAAFGRFVERFPDVAALAAASRADVLREWAGLGYNRRAVALSEAARAIVRDHGGLVPRDPAVLARLPGVGPYTAAAVASLGHGVCVSAVDVNVHRVVARAGLGLEPAAASPVAVRQEAEGWLDRTDPGAWNQALMDLGRDVCRPAPRCAECPISPDCRWRRDEAAPPTRDRRRPAQPAFEGSFRQVRGGVVRVLRERSGSTVADIAGHLGREPEEVARAVAALASEGLVEADAGRVRLARA